MAIIEVQVQRDHLERLATAKSPISAIAELVWNALDADASKVEVRLVRNELGGIDQISVADDGHGLAAGDVVAAFARLGGSWKLKRPKTKGGRILHGQQGKGRFQAFALGAQVEWKTCYGEGGALHEYKITGSRASLKRFSVDDPVASKATHTGTTVKISGIERSLSALESDRTRQSLTEEFALYLREYASVAIVYSGREIDASEIENHVEDYPLEMAIAGGREVQATLTVIEWAISTERALYLCDANGFTVCVNDFETLVYGY